MSAYRYSLPEPVNVDNTIHQFNEVASIPELTGSTVLTLDFSQIVTFRSGVSSYLKFIVDWGDKSAQGVLEKNSGYNPGDYVSISHKYIPSKFPKAKFICTVTCLTDNLVLDTYTLIIVVNQPKLRGKADQFQILESHVYSTEDSEIDNLSLIVETPDQENVSNILIPRDKKQRKGDAKP